MFFLSRSLDLSEALQRFSASALQRFSASALQRFSASARLFSTLLRFILFNSVLMLLVSGCEGRGVHGSPQAGSISAAEKASGRYSLPLVPSEANLKLGQVATGSQKSCAFWLTNQIKTPVEVIEITSSCDCLTIELPKRLLAPGQKVEGRIELDLRKESRFTGNLGISVRGTGKKNETVFEMEVQVAVGNDRER